MSELMDMALREAEREEARNKLMDLMSQQQYEAGLSMGRMQLATQILAIMGFNEDNFNAIEQEVFDLVKETMDNLGKTK